MAYTEDELYERSVKSLVTLVMALSQQNDVLKDKVKFYDNLFGKVHKMVSVADEDVISDTTKRPVGRPRLSDEERAQRYELQKEAQRLKYAAMKEQKNNE